MGVGDKAKILQRHPIRTILDLSALHLFRETAGRTVSAQLHQCVALLSRMPPPISRATTFSHRTTCRHLHTTDPTRRSSGWTKQLKMKFKHGASSNLHLRLVEQYTILHLVRHRSRDTIRGDDPMIKKVVNEVAKDRTGPIAKALGRMETIQRHIGRLVHMSLIRDASSYSRQSGNVNACRHGHDLISDQFRDGVLWDPESDVSFARQWHLTG